MNYSVFVSKKSGFDSEQITVLEKLKNDLNFNQDLELKIINHYLIESDEKLDIQKINSEILHEKNLDDLIDIEEIKENYDLVLAIRLLAGQFDQRADSTEQLIEITCSKKARVRAAKVYMFKGKLSDDEIEKIKNYLINPVENFACSIEELNHIEKQEKSEEKLEYHSKFREKSREELEIFLKDNSLSLHIDDLVFIQEYFQKENRDPSHLEIRVLDTYWSDHCRHSTFATILENIKIEDKAIKKAFDKYLEIKKRANRQDRAISLMDLATINMKDYLARNKDSDIDISEEINACSIERTIKLEGKREKDILLMFKNETHNHPTEIEPFGGAATCLGGAIRDPLSGRAYVYGAIRISGAANPNTKLEDTLKGKLHQHKICLEAANGYSSYGNQIGIATGLVKEFYHPNFVAKRFELGAVIASVPRENVKRLEPKKGDIVLLLGGRTGRDGVGGASGSSKSHDESSIKTSGAEVQKGNPPVERRMLRYFMDEKIASKIKRCNDFGAGGVSVAVGEIADSIDIYLDKIIKKYDGLSHIDLALSESQERMALVIDEKDFDLFQKKAVEENLELASIAKVTDTGLLRMYMNDEKTLEISRKFLDTGGIVQRNDIEVPISKNPDEFFKRIDQESLEQDYLKLLKDKKISSQKSLIEMFDGTIGSMTALSQLGGKNSLSPENASVKFIPYNREVSKTLSCFSYGYDPYLAEFSPFLGAYYSTLLSISRLVARGFDYKLAKLSLQEYFESLGTDKKKWAKPFSALLGSILVQDAFDTPAIGGKDSMSGSFNDISVPPSLVSFAVASSDTKPISAALKSRNSSIYLSEVNRDEEHLSSLIDLKSEYDKILSQKDEILSMHAVDSKSVVVNLIEMALGNEIGFEILDENIKGNIEKDFGSIMVELPNGIEPKFNCKLIAKTNDKNKVKIASKTYSFDDLIKSYTETNEKIYPKKYIENKEIKNICYTQKNYKKRTSKISKPKVFVPVFPGTNCEFDTIRAFEKAGAVVKEGIFNNLSQAKIKESIELFAREIENSEILALPGGFSAADEPEGSAKFINGIFRNEKIRKAFDKLVNERDGLVIGICNGFQALIKLGVFQDSKISEIEEDSISLSFNKNSRHMAKIVKTRVSSINSPWLKHQKLGDEFAVAISHGEGRFYANDKNLEKLIENGQIISQYIDDDSNASMDYRYNPNGSIMAVEAIVSPCGKILGKMGHTERYRADLYQNLNYKFDDGLFKSAVEYFSI